MADGVIVVGAGVGGLAAALALAARGVPVQLLERAAAPGGKMRRLPAGEAGVDAGPTVFTMRWVFDELFDEAGLRLDDALALEPSRVLARHAWPDGSRLDLLADLEASVQAIAAFAGPAEGERYRDFCRRAAQIHQALDRPFLRAQRPAGPLGLLWRGGREGLPGLMRISPFGSMWGALGRHFRDPRLRQLFGRYATYCGSSPFLAPATLMLVAHVEREGVWRVAGGMHRVAQVLAAQARRLGAQLRYEAPVAQVLVEGGRACGVRLASGEELRARAVVFNGDVAALADGLLGPVARRAVPATAPARRSLSAITWTGLSVAEGLPLVRHNVCFSSDCPREFETLMPGARLPAEPTVYLCAQDRGDDDAPRPEGERLLCLVNAPALGDAPGGRALSDEEIAACEQATFSHLRRCGVHLRSPPTQWQRTTPAGFEQLFPATGGALYGRASHGWLASFQRPGSRSRLPGLYLAGGSTHPGPGVPMAALSGRRAAESVLADLASTRAWHPVATSGGTSTP